MILAYFWQKVTNIGLIWQNRKASKPSATPFKSIPDLKLLLQMRYTRVYDSFSWLLDGRDVHYKSYFRCFSYWLFVPIFVFLAKTRRRWKEKEIRISKNTLQTSTSFFNSNIQMCCKETILTKIPIFLENLLAIFRNKKKTFSENIRFWDILIW